MKSIDCISCINQDCFIKLCSAEWMKKTDQNKEQLIYRKGWDIIKEGAKVLGVYFIQKGKVKVFSSGMNGREQIVRFAGDGHILGHRGIGNDVYPIGAIAMDDSLICFIRNETLNELFYSNPRFPVELMMYYSRELRKMESRMKNIAQMNIREKTAETLLLLKKNFGIKKNNEIDVEFSREDIASAAGSTRQQVTMQLTEFENDGYILKRGRKIVLINSSGLEKIISKFEPS